MLNRSAVVVRPRQPFVDWLKSVEELDLPDMTLDQLEKTLYLVPDYEDPSDAKKVLKKVCDEIFCRELEGWYTDEETWPRDRSLKVFKQCSWLGAGVVGAVVVAVDIGSPGSGLYDVSSDQGGICVSGRSRVP